MLATTAIRLGLVNEFRLFVQPALLGVGTPFFPPEEPMALELIDTRRFKSGVVYLAYRRRSA